MKIKTFELSGVALDWAVAKCEGIPEDEIYISKVYHTSLYRRNKDEDGNPDGTYTTGPNLIFSRKWESGGPIIEREGINSYFSYIGVKVSHWVSNIDGVFTGKGQTLLIAAMRCYVASKLGSEVDIPKELL